MAAPAVLAYERYLTHWRTKWQAALLPPHSVTPCDCDSAHTAILSHQLFLDVVLC